MKLFTQNSKHIKNSNNSNSTQKVKNQSEDYLNQALKIGENNNFKF